MYGSINYIGAKSISQNWNLFRNFKFFKSRFSWHFTSWNVGIFPYLHFLFVRSSNRDKGILFDIIFIVMTISVLVPWRHAVRHHQWLITAPTNHALFCVGGFPQVPVVDDSLSSCYKHNTISHVLFICTINCSYWINTSITIYVMFCYYSKTFGVIILKNTLLLLINFVW